MKIITSGEYKQEKTGIALGTFDGLHLGHVSLIRTLVSHARERGVGALVYTFKNIPAEYFGASGIRIFSARQKERAIERLGVDLLCMNRFDAHFANVRADEFLDMLFRSFDISFLIAGENHTFGAGKGGDFAMLKRYAEARGADVYMQQGVYARGELVSSTRVRDLILRGEIGAANALTLYPYALQGHVISGRGLGGTLGFKTANLAFPPWKARIKNGVYVTETTVDGVTYPSVTNVGVRPTVEEHGRILTETHIIGFNGDIYNKEIEVAFLEYLRDERKFDDIQALKAQVMRDIDAGKSCLQSK